MDPLREIDNDLSIQKKKIMTANSQFHRIYPHPIPILPTVNRIIRFHFETNVGKEEKRRRSGKRKAETKKLECRKRRRGP